MLIQKLGADLDVGDVVSDGHRLLRLVMQYPSEGAYISRPDVRLYLAEELAGSLVNFALLISAEHPVVPEADREMPMSWLFAYYEDDLDG